MKPLNFEKRQSGFVLILTLGILVVLTVLGLSASGTTAMETLMARNFRDRDSAFAAAEQALRDAELRITGYYSNPATPVNPYSFPDIGATPACVSGLCFDTKIVDKAGAQLTTAKDKEDFFISGSTSQEMGDWTTSANKTQDVAGLAVQPRHIIERVNRQQPGTSLSSGQQWIYRITVQAQGRLGTSRVALQELYVP